MKHLRTISTKLAAVLLVAAAGAQTGNAAEVIEGNLSQVTDKSITIDSAKTYKFDPAKAECFDFRKDRMTCATLVAIGYADKARVTFVGDAIQRIDILELQQ